jgi:hypothetical protein
MFEKSISFEKSYSEPYDPKRDGSLPLYLLDRQEGTPLATFRGSEDFDTLHALGVIVSGKSQITVKLHGDQKSTTFIVDENFLLSKISDKGELLGVHIDPKILGDRSEKKTPCFEISDLDYDRVQKLVEIIVPEGR